MGRQPTLHLKKRGQGSTTLDAAKRKTREEMKWAAEAFAKYGKEQVKHGRNMSGGQGKRNRDIKKALRESRIVDPALRVARLVKLAHEKGPEYIQHEIAIHERKLADMRAALAQYEAETTAPPQAQS